MAHEVAHGTPGKGETSRNSGRSLLVGGDGGSAESVKYGSYRLTDHD
jgi:hypothetical protein